MNPWQVRAAQSEIESEGIKVAVADYPNWEFTIGRECPWNQDYARALARVMAHPRVMSYIERSAKPGYVPAPGDDVIETDAQRDAFAEGILKGWRGVTGEDGKPLKFTPANARRVLAHFPEIYYALQREARNSARFMPVPEKVKASIAEGN